MRRLLLALLLTIIFSALQTNTAFACSYGFIPPITLDDFSARDVIVKGTIIEGSGRNFIIAVDEYLKGGGERLLLIYRQNPREYYLQYILHYNTYCIDPVRFATSIGTTAYFALNRNNDGSYGIGEMYTPVDGQISYAETIDPEGDRFDEDNYEWHSVTEAEFRDLITVADAQTIPERTQSLRRRPLILTTESGQRYAVPIDNGEVYQLMDTPCTENCRIYAPNGVHFAHMPDESTIHFRYSASDSTEYDTYIPPSSVVDGQAVLFAPDSSSVLVWYDNQLSLYFVEPYLSDYSHWLVAYTIWSTTLATSDTITADNLQNYAAWSDNSAVFVYGDANGLWYFDFYTQAEPRLILEFDGVLPPLIELSITGRYLRYGDVDEWTLLDLVTGTQYDDGVISPDELHLALIDPEDFCYLTDCQPRPDVASYFLPLQRDLGIVALVEVTNDESAVISWAWVDSLTFYYVLCEDAERNDCTENWHTNNRVSRFTIPPTTMPIRQVVYDSIFGTRALQTGDYSLSLDGGYSQLDLTDILDSPIVAIEWGASLWYVGE